MNSKIKILIVTDSAVLPTGLAETTRLIFEHLLERNPARYEVEQIGLYHCYAVTAAKWRIHATELGADEKGRPCFASKDRYGQKTFRKLLPKLRPDIVFLFGDPQAVVPLCSPPESRSHKLVVYVNFDGLPVTSEFGERLSFADRVITKTAFSADVVRRFLPQVAAEKIGYFYSPADTGRFSPITAEARMELRRELFPDWMPRDAFVVGWVGRNQWRKQVWIIYKALRYLRNGHYMICRRCLRASPYDWEPGIPPDGAARPLASERRPGQNANVCFHCQSSDVETAKPIRDLFLWCHMPEEPDSDWAVNCLEQHYGVQPGRDIHYTPGYVLKGALAPADVPTLYNLWDCLLFLSGGEGFGLPAWEAMCSGIPTIYTNYSAHAEFLSRANAGIPVGGVLQPEAKSCIWRMVADLGQVIEAVQKLYSDPSMGHRLGENGRLFVQQFTPALVAEKWDQLFCELATRA
jgi:glycosyltransferase involved in cell wall biosynthesis